MRSWLTVLVVALAAYPGASWAQPPQPPPPYPAAPPPATAPPAAVAAPSPAAPAAPAASRLLVAPGSGRNLSANIVLRARSYVFAALAERCPTCQVMDAGAVAQAAPVDGPTASALAGQFGATVVLALDLERSQDLTRFTLLVFRGTSPGGPPPEPQLLRHTTSEGPESLWPVVWGLVGRLYQRVPERTTATATAGQPAAPRRFFLAAAGGMVAQLNSAGRDDRFLPALAVAIAHHADTSMLDVRLELATMDDAHRTGLGLSYAVRTSPNWSFGLAASWVWLRLGGRGATGPAVAPVVSYLIPIPGGPSFRFEAGYALNLFREQEVDRLIPGSDAAHWSHGPQLMIGVVL